MPNAGSCASASRAARLPETSPHTATSAAVLGVITIVVQACRIPGSRHCGCAADPGARDGIPETDTTIADQWVSKPLEQAAVTRLFDIDRFLRQRRLQHPAARPPGKHHL